MSLFEIDDSGRILCPNGEKVRLVGTRKNPLSSRERALRDFAQSGVLPPRGSTDRLICCGAFGITAEEEATYDEVPVPLEQLEDVSDDSGDDVLDMIEDDEV